MDTNSDDLHIMIRQGLCALIGAMQYMYTTVNQIKNSMAMPIVNRLVFKTLNE